MYPTDERTELDPRGLVLLLLGPVLLQIRPVDISGVTSELHQRGESGLRTLHSAENQTNISCTEPLFLKGNLLVCVSVCVRVKKHV